jgi:signal transduction histidine kinase
MRSDHLQGLESGITGVSSQVEGERASATFDTRPGNTTRIAVIGAAVLVIGGLHFLMDERLVMWHSVLHHLYVLPIMYAALRFGWRGSLVTTAAASILFVSHALTMHPAQLFPGQLLSKSIELLEFCFAAAVIGVLSERDHRQHRTLEQTTKRLSQVYQELQGSFERMKQSERLYAAGQLSAGLAHEIRNPIASISGAAELLQRNAASEQRRRDCLGIISKECNRLNDLLTSFMDFAKPRMPMFQTVSVEPMLSSSMELAAHAIGRQPITLRQNFAPELPSLDCDAEQIKQVLLNLLLNAIQAMPKGGEITVSAAVENGFILIAVRDRGCGVSAENMGRLFDPFFTTKETGTGLGLPVANQIVAQHGGSLRADPNLEGGMTFSIRLPLQRIEVA